MEQCGLIRRLLSVIIVINYFFINVYTLFIKYILNPMARTNKRGIAAKKAQIQKQAGRLKGLKRFNYPKRKL